MATITTQDGTQIFYALHGKDDQVVPIDEASRQTITLLRRGTLKTYPGLPHGMCTTHRDVINAGILAFVRG